MAAPDDSIDGVESWRTIRLDNASGRLNKKTVTAADNYATETLSAKDNARSQEGCRRRSRASFA
jgi:hypothetical protein